MLRITSQKRIKNLSVIAGLIFYRIVADLAYFFVISPVYGYSGFKDNHSFGWIALSWFIVLAFMRPIIQLINRSVVLFSDTVTFILSIITIIPFSTMVASGIFTTRFVVLNIVYWCAMFAFHFYFSHRSIKGLKIKMGDVVLDDRISMIAGILSLVLVLYISYKYTHFRLNFNLFDVYELREEVKSYNFPVILQYLFAWSRAINNVFLAYSIVKKKYWMAMIFFIAQMLSFGIDGLKSTFFMPILVLIICLIFKNGMYVMAKKLIVWGVTGLTSIGLLEWMFFGSYNVINILIRRVLFVPTYLNYCYVDYFSTHTPDFFKASFLRYFGFETSYPDIGEIIGGVYFNKSTMNCNNGLISDAITNFGVAGIILMPFLFMVILRMMDKCSKGMDEKIFLATAVYFAIVISNTFLMTALLTHGFIIVCIILLLMSSSKVGKYEVRD